MRLTEERWASPFALLRLGVGTWVSLWAHLLGFVAALVIASCPRLARVSARVEAVGGPPEIVPIEVFEAAPVAAEPFEAPGTPGVFAAGAGLSGEPALVPSPAGAFDRGPSVREVLEAAPEGLPLPKPRAKPGDRARAARIAAQLEGLHIASLGALDRGSGVQGVLSGGEGRVLDDLVGSRLASAGGPDAGSASAGFARGGSGGGSLRAGGAGRAGLGDLAGVRAGGARGAADGGGRGGGLAGRGRLASARGAPGGMEGGAGGGIEGGVPAGAAGGIERGVAGGVEGGVVGGVVGSIDAGVVGSVDGGAVGDVAGATDAAPRSRIRLASISRTGALEEAAVARPLRLASVRLRRCYETSLRSEPTIAGRVALSLQIDAGGGVSSASDLGPPSPGSTDLDTTTISDPELLRCMIGTVKALSFPVAEPAGATTVIARFELSAN